MYKLDLEKAEEPEIKLPKSVGSNKKQENPRKNIYFCFVLVKPGLEILSITLLACEMSATVW